MSDRTCRQCIEEGCRKPREKREWCAAHYSLWRRHGTPTPKRTGQCIECGETVQGGARGAIPKRCPDCLRKHRCAQVMALYVPVVQFRDCQECGERYRAPGRDTKSLRCPPCRKRVLAEQKAAWKRAHPRSPTGRKPGRPRGSTSQARPTGAESAPRKPRLPRTTERHCMVCGITPETGEWRSRTARWCSGRCERLWYRYDGNIPEWISCAKCGEPFSLIEPVGDRSRRRSDARYCKACAPRSRLKITAADLAAEDGATCRLCGEPVDMTIRLPKRLTATVDHIIPRALGGSDDRENLQLAHFGCNASKRHRVK